jgi:hypothetical protein
MKRERERERRGKGGRSLGSLWKKKKKQGQCDFLEPKFWADQKEHSALGQSRNFLIFGQLQAHSGSSEGEQDLAIWQNRKLEM